MKIANLIPTDNEIVLEIDSWHGISPPLKDAIGWADEDMERAREERGNG